MAKPSARARSRSGKNAFARSCRQQARPSNTAIIRLGAAGPCALALEVIVSKRADAPYAPGNRGLWLNVECLDHEEFVVLSRICFPFSGPGFADNGILSRGQ